MGDFTQISNQALTTLPDPAAESEKTLVPASPAESDLWIFRDGRRTVSGKEMIRELSARLTGNGPQTLTDALIQAGELEAALADAGSASADVSAELTDALATRVCGQEWKTDPLELLRSIDPPPSLSIAPPEGFTYYALHPADFAAVVSQIPEEPRACAVVGIRSIGTTLSAMTVAALHGQARPATRMTVRPTGHPYSRVARFTDEQLRWIHGQMAQGAQFLVVDEGPGRSGSTFLSVAEALSRAGVSIERITLIGSREAQSESLCAQDAVTRWSRFRFLCTRPSENRMFEHCRYIGGGAWREVFLPSLTEWPESWTQMERLKFISPDRRTVFKFEGMGPIGARVRERAFVLAEAGFSPRADDAGGGFLAYSLAQGQRLRAEDVNGALLDQIAQYCAFRATTFSCAQSGPFELGSMLEFNLRQEFGVDLAVSQDALLPRSPVLCDGRMQMYEWIANGPNHLVKVDAIDHGDNHFFPGPCDIAWDIAGVAIEWQLGPDAVTAVTEKFRRFSGIEVSSELPLYLLAYSVFRLGFCKMALSGATDSREEGRLRAAYARYRSQAERLLKSVAPASERVFAA